MKITFIKSIALILIILIIFSAIGCGGEDGTPTPTPTTEPTATIEPVPTTQILTAVEVYEQVSSAIAFINTPAGTGSGLLLDDGYIATCAHVVWPYSDVSVVFSDGSEYSEVPVLGLDLLCDLAVIGPIDTTIEPLPLVDGEDIAIGSEVFLIGYPIESEELPQPTISQGILSRLREWNAIQMTYLQTSADIDSGQSGGVLVSQAGEIIGISGYSLGEAFAIAASSKDISARLEGMIAGDDVDGLGNRTFSLEGGEFYYMVELGNHWDTKMFVINEPVGTEIEIAATSDNNAVLWIADIFGAILAEVVNDTIFATTEFEYDKPCFFILGQSSESSGTFEITTNCELIEYDDPEDGKSILVGETILGNLDYPGDYDWFELHLEIGETVQIIVDSLMIDAYVEIDYPGASEEDGKYDDNSGGGLSSTNAKLIYEAPHSGDYLLVVSDTYDSWNGGYIVTTTLVE